MSGDTGARARAAFAEWSGTTPEVLASAPGRINLVGGHTDYNDGFVLPAAVDRRTAAAVGSRDDGVVAVRTTNLDETVSVDVDGITNQPETPWADYVLGVVDEFEADLDGGLDVLVSGDVPTGAGLSSSASLELAVAGALDELLGTGLPPKELALRGWRAETGFVGLDCGIMDQFAAALGQRGHALFLDCRSREAGYVPVDRGAVGLVVVDTNVEHELADSAYNDRVAECRRAVERLSAYVDGIGSLRDLSRETFVAHADALPGVLRRRARHVVTENERVRLAADALACGNHSRVGELMNASHDSLRDDYEVSCAELDTAVDVARSVPGVLGARMTGGGFGGSVVCLVEVTRAGRLWSSIDEEYPERTGIEADVYRLETADGVRVEPPSEW